LAEKTKPSVVTRVGRGKPAGPKEVAGLRRLLPAEIDRGGMRQIMTNEYHKHYIYHARRMEKHRGETTR
jgi:hypothetical protein